MGILMKNNIYDEEKYPKNKYPWMKTEVAFSEEILKKQYSSYKHRCEFKEHYGENVCKDCESYDFCQNAWQWDGK